VEDGATRILQWAPRWTILPLAPARRAGSGPVHHVIAALNAAAAEDHYHMNAIHYRQQEQSSDKMKQPPAEVSAPGNFTDEKFGPG
jgi:hypothetical protein